MAAVRLKRLRACTHYLPYCAQVSKYSMFQVLLFFFLEFINLKLVVPFMLMYANKQVVPP